MKTSYPECLKCQNDTFELRLLRDEAVGSARCVNCSSDYLLLDSKDYWFDVIQKGYPRLTLCSCKNKNFRLKIDYSVRDDGDIDYIEVHSICSACGKTRRQMDYEIDYGGTGHLFKNPLVPCRNPKVLYDLENINLLLMSTDMHKIIDHLAYTEHCTFVSRLRLQDKWASIQQEVVAVKKTIDEAKYLFIYAIPNQINIPENRVNTIKKENTYWKQSEVIRIGSKSHIIESRLDGNHTVVGYASEPSILAHDTEIGLSFNIDFSNEFVRSEKIVSKSKAFQNVTASLLTMLQDEFVCWRGPHCFDNPDVNVRVFGNRFRRSR